MLDSRTERDHLHALVFGTDDTALQTGMNSDDTRLGAELFLVRLFHRLEQTALEVRFPTRISTVKLHLCAG